MQTPDSKTVLSALAWEARRRGVDYGTLCAALREGEQERILRAYRKEEASRRKARKERAAARKRNSPPCQTTRLNTQEAAALLSQGLSDGEIARLLGVSAQTVSGWKHRTGR